MSEVSMGMENVASPAQRAMMYLEAQQHGKEYIPKSIKKGEAAIQTHTITAPFRIIPEVRRAEPLVKSVTAYEQMVDDLSSEKAKQIFEKLRPTAYKAIELSQWGARMTDGVITAAMFIPTKGIDFKQILARGAGVYTFMRFRPVEWVTEQATKMELGAIGKVADLIWQGGEPKAEQPLPAEAPAAA